MKLALLAATAAVASAACPNQCSGHGTCQQQDKCACYENWTGADCSLRMCEYGRSWAKNDNDPHAYQECSGQGVCNRNTGECECFDGFKGSSCSRSVCPNDCSGKGVCKLLSEVEQTVQYDASNWDVNRIQTCVCDPGFFGSDCSQRYCPTGDDPLTLCANKNKNMVQEVRFVLGSETLHDIAAGTVGSYVSTAGSSSPQMAIFGAASSLANAGAKAQLRLKYVAPDGSAWSTQGISNVYVSTDATARDSMEVGLETIPDNKVRDVSILTTASSSFNGVVSGVPTRVYQVTFKADEVNSNLVGIQKNLQCDTGYSCTEAGCSPMVNMPFLYRYGTVAVRATPTTSFTDASPTFYTVAAPGVDQITLHADTQPQLPAGVAVDTKVSSTDKARYDMRILVAVSDPSTGANGNDVFYTKVVLGHEKIFASSVWSATSATASLDGFTYQGVIPSSFDKVAIEGAPGVYVTFPSRNIVDIGKTKFYEIMVKLPHCTVTPNLKAGDVKVIGTGADAPLVDANVENMECAGRGFCDRDAGVCKCYEGFYGVACHRQTVLV